MVFSGCFGQERRGHRCLETTRPTKHATDAFRTGSGKESSIGFSKGLLNTCVT